MNKYFTRIRIVYVAVVLLIGLLLSGAFGNNSSKEYKAINDKIDLVIGKIDNVNNKQIVVIVENNNEEKDTTDSKDNSEVFYQGIHEKDISNIIYNIMLHLGEPNPRDFTALLMATAYVESNMGVRLTQRNGGAKSIFQIEKITENDILKIFLPRNKELQEKVMAMKPVHIDGLDGLTHSISYSVAVAYCIYKWRLPDGVPPSKDDIESIAKAHKKHYNTSLGKSNVQESIAKIR